MTKADIIRTGIELGIDYGITSSCYDPAPRGGRAAAAMPVLRSKGFAEAGIDDPLLAKFVAARN